MKFNRTWNEEIKRLKTITDTSCPCSAIFNSDAKLCYSWCGFGAWNFHLHLSYFNMCCGFEQMSNSLQMWSHLNYKIWLSLVKKQRDEKWLRRRVCGKKNHLFSIKRTSAAVIVSILNQTGNGEICVTFIDTILCVKRKRLVQGTEHASIDKHN